LLPIVVMCFWIGLYPKPFFEIIEKPVEYIVQKVDPEYAAMVASDGASSVDVDLVAEVED
jgi:NADH:ubiquinone oxidoreductase subunit 4 (subunit M)